LGYGWHIGVSRELDPPDRLQCLEQVLAAIEGEADRLGLSLSFAQVLDEEVELCSLLVERGYLTSRNVPIASLDVRWSSMDEYFHSLPRRHRKTFRRESRRNAEAGVTIQIQKSCSGLEERLLELLDNNAQTHGGLHCPFRPEIFSELESSMAGDALWFLARKGGAISGVLLGLRHQNSLVAFAVGVDNELGKGDFTYFQLCYHCLIDYAMSHGIKRIDYGRGMYPIKVRRGCRLSGASLYTRMKGRYRTVASLWYSVASLWNRYKLPPSLRRRIGSAWRP
jgi:predicted N-acyltransferase